MTARASETRRRRRERQEAREIAERESVCGGPLIDIGRPIIGGGDDQHPYVVANEIARRIDRLRVEADLLAMHFVRQCWVRLDEAHAMRAHYLTVIADAGPPRLAVRESTMPGVGSGTIPRLETTASGT